MSSSTKTMSLQQGGQKPAEAGKQQELSNSQRSKAMWVDWLSLPLYFLVFYLFNNKQWLCGGVGALGAGVRV